MEVMFEGVTYRVTRHAFERMAVRGMTLALLQLTLREPDMTYNSGKFAGQRRVVKGEFVVTLDTTRRTIPTVFFNGRRDTETFNRERGNK